MAYEPTVYSFTDLTGAISHPLTGDFLFSGDKMGVGSLAVNMLTEKTVVDTAADGGVMMSWVPGDAGHVVISCQQTSAMHKYLLATYNAVKGSTTRYKFSLAGLLRNVNTGTSHQLSGGGFQKLPDMPYEAQGQRVSWVLPFGDVQSIPA
jgi:hypothetical protein